MQSSRRLCSLLAALALSFFAIATAPTRALAEWEEASGSYTYVTSSVSAGNLKVGPLVQQGLTGYGSLIKGGDYITGSDYTAYNTKPTGNVYVVYMLNQPNHLAKGSKVVVSGATGYLRTNASSVPTTYSSWDSKKCTVSEVRYFVSDSNNGNQTEVFLDETGAIKLPYSANYLFCATRLNNFQSVINGAVLWYPLPDFKFKYELPSDQNEVAAIESQTETLTDTTGSDTSVDNPLAQGVQIVQGVNFVSQTASFVTGAVDAVMDTEPSTGLTFPGLEIMGNQILAEQNVPFTGYLSEGLEDTIRTGVTLVLFLAWVNGLVGLYHKIFLGEQEVEVTEE